MYDELDFHEIEMYEDNEYYTSKLEYADEYVFLHIEVNSPSPKSINRIRKDFEPLKNRLRKEGFDNLYAYYPLSKKHMEKFAKLIDPNFSKCSEYDFQGEKYGVLKWQLHQQ